MRFRCCRAPLLLALFPLRWLAKINGAIPEPIAIPVKAAVTFATLTFWTRDTGLRRCAVRGRGSAYEFLPVSLGVSCVIESGAARFQKSIQSTLVLGFRF